MMTIQKLLFGCIALLCSSMIFAQTPVNASSDAAQATAANVAPQGGDKKAMRAANRQFSKTVQRAIYKDQRNSEDIDIVVFGNAKTGKVKLAGFITELSEEQEAIKAARQVPGVTSVTSGLTLREEGN